LLDSIGSGLGTATHTALGKDLPNVMLGSLLADYQPSRDLTIGQPVGYQG